LTKTISLADDAYDALASVKRPGESFSDLARRLAREAAVSKLFDPDRAPLLSDVQADAMKRAIRKARDEDKRKPVSFR
jgi:predicted CopG family antitoxin